MSKRIGLKEMAKLIGISRNQYFLIETGKTKSISFEIAIAIAKILQVPFDDLYEIDQDITNDIDLEKEIKKYEDEFFIEILKNRGYKILKPTEFIEI